MDSNEEKEKACSLNMEEWRRRDRQCVRQDLRKMNISDEMATGRGE
jgi:hypothetical protein